MRVLCLMLVYDVFHCLLLLPFCVRVLCLMLILLYSSLFVIVAILCEGLVFDAGFIM